MRSPDFEPGADRTHYKTHQPIPQRNHHVVAADVEFNFGTRSIVGRIFPDSSKGQTQAEQTAQDLNQRYGNDDEVVGFYTKKLEPDEPYWRIATLEEAIEGKATTDGGEFPIIQDVHGVNGDHLPHLTPLEQLSPQPIRTRADRLFKTIKQTNAQDRRAKFKVIIFHK